jgi:hypothetical protein
MVFKKKARRSFRGFAKKSRSYAGNSSIKPMDILIAGAIYGAARPFAAKLLPNMFTFGPVDSDNVLIGAAGFYGMKKGKGLIKARGAAANIGNAGTDAYQY